MSKVFVSKIDNKKFSTKEELISYLSDNFILEDTADGEIATIHKKLQEAFPFADISVKTNESKYDNDYGKYLASMIWKDFDADFSFYIGEHNKYDYYYRSYDTVEQAINVYQTYLDRKDEILKNLKEVYSPEDISILQMYEGDMHDNNSILFQITLNKKEYIERYEFGSVEEFVLSFRGYFDKVIEGDVIRGYNHADGYEYEPTIGGVPLKNIIERAKKLRIEILEENK